MFEWDNTKAKLNFEKHGVSFLEATTCFEDIKIFLYHDVGHSASEDRYFAIAESVMNRILAMVFTVRRDSNGQKIYRIISARSASKKERSIHSGQTY
jgi:uncharacterized protein